MLRRHSAGKTRQLRGCGVGSTTGAGLSLLLSLLADMEVELNPRLLSNDNITRLLLFIHCFDDPSTVRRDRSPSIRNVLIVILLYFLSFLLSWIALVIVN